MLVLTRKVNQQIRLGDDITVTILRVQGNSIRIGVEAPRNVRVVRGELSPLSESTGSESQIATSPTELPSVDKGPGSFSPANSSEDTQVLEFDLDNLDAETLQSLEAAAEHSPDCAKVYHMRTSAPLARFFPSQAREAVSNYTV